MNKKEINTVLQIMDLALKYGVPAISDAVNRSEKKVITEEVVQNLKIDKQWEDFFDKKIKDTVKSEVDKQSQTANRTKTSSKTTAKKKTTKSSITEDDKTVDEE